MSNELHNRPLPQGLVDELANPPAAGSGIHAWAFTCARWIAPWRPPQEAVRILTEAAAKCSRPVPLREIEDAVKNARNDWQPETKLSRVINSMGRGGIEPRAKAWPDPDWKAIAAIAKTGRTIADLAAASPDTITRSTGEIITILWHGDPLLCLAKSHPADSITRRRSEWLADSKDIAENGLIVPNPMQSREGLRQDGKPSVRCLDNVGPRWFLVVEFDFKADHNGTATPAAAILATLAAETPPRTAPDLCAAILLHLLSVGAPLMLAVHSGGKSVHGWFPVHGADDDALRPFFTAAVRLGADPATWCRCQLVRLPGGTRTDGTHQRILYFNPARIHAA